MKKIGGFFELELNKKTEYHPEAIKLNTGRNALEYLLRLKEYKKVYLPYYICQSVIEPINKLGIDYSFYQINENFQAELDFTFLGESDVFLYVNYFGVNDSNVQYYVDLSKDLNFNICIDNTQSFFSKPHEDIDTFYSPRKFLGVPDGAYLYTKNDQCKILNLPQGYGYDKTIHLLKRIDLGPNESYKDYKAVSNMHKHQEIKEMSLLSQAILASLDYSSIKATRLENFKYVANHLDSFNNLSINIDQINTPMIYPLYIKKEGLREYLISKDIFVATYWNDVLKNVLESQFEHALVHDIIAIPIDQRYGLEEMDYIVNKTLEYIDK